MLALIANVLISADKKFDPPCTTVNIEGGLTQEPFNPTSLL